MKKKCVRSNKSGFTLVELILYVAISSVLLTSLILFSWDLIYGRVKSTIHQNVNQNIRFISKRIFYEIRNSTGINSISSTSISLSFSDSSRNPTVIDLSGGRVRIGWGSGGSCPVSNPCYLSGNNVTVSDLSFTDLSLGESENIRFSITVDAVSERREFEKSASFSSSAEVR